MSSLRSAATLLVLARSVALNEKHTYRILFVKRSSASTFMASRHVFPGGVLEKSDFAFAPQPQVPCIEHEAVGTRFGALRELFEETGVLLVESNDRVKCVQADGSYREQVRKSPEFFPQVYSAMAHRPPLAQLMPWSRWITPVVEPRRYDTYFYVVTVDADAADIQALSDSQANEASGSKQKVETVSTVWLSPTEALRADANNDILLAPPTVYVLTELLHCKDMHDVSKLCGDRAFTPVQPVITLQDENVVVLLPGDADFDSDTRSDRKSRRHRLTAKGNTQFAIQTSPDLPLGYLWRRPRQPLARL